MMHLIDDLKVIPGVIGACVFHYGEGLKMNNLPAIFKPERLNAVGSHLQRLHAAGQLSLSGLTDVVVSFDESAIVARELGEDYLVYVICDPSYNANLLSVSLNLLKEEFSSSGFSEALAGSEKNAEGRDESSADISSEEAGMRADQLKAVLEEIKADLARHVGPMAEFIFDEAYEDWTEEGADFSRIDALTDELVQGIDDEERADKCRLSIVSIIEQHRAR